MHLNKDREVPTVLVVDDDITVRLLAHESLSSDGFTVVEAEDGAQALTVFQEVRPDIVLMDVEMPNLDGFAACKQLREFSYGRQIPF